ncbi:MAG: hypothetical protein OXQ29_18855 [Rhodospirillaceae bacterium]|nr:hypothetical protein [Rhodospirillaceae bacterium]
MSDRTETPEQESARLARNRAIRLKMIAARKAGNQEESSRLFCKLVFSARILRMCKGAFGADWIRRHNLDTHLAEAEFGPGWLDD